MLFRALPMNQGLMRAFALSGCATFAFACNDSSVVAHRSAPSVALANLISSLHATDDLYGRGDRPALGPRVVDLRLTRAQFLGTYAEDFQAALEVGNELVTQGAADALLTRARVRAAVHDFVGAREDLREIEAFDVGADTTTIDLAVGSGLEDAYLQRRTRADRHPGFQSAVDAAAAAAALGFADEADARYREALAHLRDPSPLPRAWVAFQRGVMWGERFGASDRAADLYREAVAWLPEFVVATVHLAELEAEAGDRPGAIARLRQAAGRSSDPEPSGLLGELLADVDPAESRMWIARAKGGYEALLEEFPLAFLDHASEFFAGPGGDPERALRLALDNLAKRRNHRAYIVGIEAALAAGRTEVACDIAVAATPRRSTSPVLDDLVTSLACGRPGSGIVDSRD